MASVQPQKKATLRSKYHAEMEQKMEEVGSQEEPNRFQPEEGAEELHGDPSADEAGEVGELLDEPPKSGESLRHLWEMAFQEFLEENDMEEQLLEETSPWVDTRAFLASFEQVAMACRWPRREWVTRLLPSLNEGAEGAFMRLDAQDRRDFQKVKAAILQWEAADREKKRQDFRRFCYQEASGPREVCAQLQELGHQWLQVEKCTKEQILEMLFLEQFLNVLPEEMQKWVQEHAPETCTQAVSLAEDFLRRLHAAEREEEQELEEVTSSQGKGQGESPKRQAQAKSETNSFHKPYAVGYAQPGTSKKKSLQWGHYGEMKLKARFPGRANTVFPYRWKQREDTQERRRSERLQRIYPVEVPPSTPPSAPLPEHQEKGSFWQEVPNSEVKICLLCGKALKGMASYIRHEMNHSGKKRYTCCYCPKGFCWRSELTRHECTHTGKKPHECSFCGEGFDRKWKRDRHQLMHARSRGRL